MLCKKPILQCPNKYNPYTLFTNASNYAFSGILTQAVDGPDDLRPIAYTSASFSNMQKVVYKEKEAFVVYQFVLKFNLYLRGSQCLQQYNHKCLEPFY